LKRSINLKLAITSVFVALLLFAVSAIDASPVSLGNASRFAALALDGNVAMSGNPSITGPVGVASSGFSFRFVPGPFAVAAAEALLASVIA